MSDAYAAWNLSRSRFVDSVNGLSQEQLNWRLHPAALTVGEMALHVAGVEILFASQLLGEEPQGELLRLRAAATNGCVNDNPFPFEQAEITPETIQAMLDCSCSIVEPLLSAPTDALLEKTIVSALGPMITGAGAFARLAFHAAYHQGQAYLIITAPGFPRSP